MTLTVVLAVAGVIIGFLFGLLVGWIRASRGDAERARLEAQLEGAQAQAQEKLGLLNEARAKLEETFKALAAETLRANSESFMNLARSQMETLFAQADGNLERRREAIEKLLRPLSESLSRYEQNLREVEKARGEAYAELRSQVSGLIQTHEMLRQQTGNLVTALRTPQTRGRWGELTLRRAVELAGMQEHCDFSEQVSVRTEEGLLRPDMVIHLPGDREMVLDSKVPLDAYLAAVEAPSEEFRLQKFTEHANQVRAHMVRLASKEYGREFRKSPEFTVLFLPGEAFFSEAVKCDPALIEDGIKRGVIIATPTTLIALLKAVAYGWRQTRLDENARKISETGRDLYDRISTFLRHLAELGGALKHAVDGYNRAVGSLERRIVPSARRLKELGATSAPDVSAPDTVDRLPRAPVPEGGGEPHGTEDTAQAPED